MQATTNANAQVLAMNNGFNSLQKEISDCCCSTNANITAQGNETRALMTKQHYESRIQSLEEKLCDEKAKNSALESQAFTTAKLAEQEARIRAENQQQTQLLIQHIQAICGTTATRM